MLAGWVGGAEPGRERYSAGDAAANSRDHAAGLDLGAGERAAGVG